MSSLLEQVMTEYVREARQLYRSLYTCPLDINGKEKMRLHMDTTARYEFLAQLFSDLNWYGWRRDDFDIAKELNR